jgi:hypothetical protein
MTGLRLSAVELKRLVLCDPFLLCSMPGLFHAQQETFTLQGRFTSMHGEIAGAVIKIAIAMSARSDSTGHFSLTLPRGITHLSTQADQ